MICNHCASLNVKEVNVSLTNITLVNVCGDCGKEVDEVDEVTKPIKTDSDLQWRDAYDSLSDGLLADEVDWDYWLGLASSNMPNNFPIYINTFPKLAEFEPRHVIYPLEDLDQCIIFMWPSQTLYCGKDDGGGYVFWAA